MQHGWKAPQPVTDTVPEGGGVPFHALILTELGVSRSDPVMKAVVNHLVSRLRQMTDQLTHV